MSNTTLSSDFFIDPAHELALFIWNKNQGVRLKAVPSYLCNHAYVTDSDSVSSSAIRKNNRHESKKKRDCAVYKGEYPSCAKVCVIEAVTELKIYVLKIAIL